MRTDPAFVDWVGRKLIAGVRRQADAVASVVQCAVRRIHAEQKQIAGPVVGGQPAAAKPAPQGGRILVETMLLGVAVAVVSVVRAWDEFDTGRAATWIFVAALGAAAVLLSFLYATMQREMRASDPRQGSS